MTTIQNDTTNAQLTGSVGTETDVTFMFLIDGTATAVELRKSEWLILPELPKKLGIYQLSQPGVPIEAAQTYWLTSAGWQNRMGASVTDSAMLGLYEQYDLVRLQQEPLETDAEPEAEVE